jgi:hypothetical protein
MEIMFINEELINLNSRKITDAGVAVPVDLGARNIVRNIP